MKLLFLFLLLISFSFIGAKKLKPVRIHKPKKLLKSLGNSKAPHNHVHHAGIQHSRPHHSKHKAHRLIQPTTPQPLYSPPFVGADSGQIPTVDQVVLIMDWLTKVISTVDVFLRLQATYPDGSIEQRQMVKNVYPPLRILLAADYTSEYKNKGLK